MRALGGVLIVCVMSLCGVGTASAGTLFYERSFQLPFPATVRYDDHLLLGLVPGGGETNDVVVTFGAGGASAAITDRSALVLPDAAGLLGILQNCTIGLNSFTCRGAPGNVQLAVQLFLGARDDRATFTTSGQMLVSGGDGNDRLTGAPGQDSFDADAGNDVLVGNGGADSLLGSRGDDTIDGGPGNDAIDLYAFRPWDPPYLGADTIRAGDGDDRIQQNDGVRDDIVCGPGADQVIADSSDLVAGDCESVEIRAPAVG
jgi:Ca2+-binding RTX toxin-like protein